jgi:hypothetical protein
MLAAAFALKGSSSTTEALFASHVNGEIDRPELDAAVAKLAASYG